MATQTYADILREQVDTLEAERASLIEELDALASDEARSAEDIEARASEITARATEILAERDAKIARAAELDAIRVERASVPKPINFIRPTEQPASASDVRSMSVGQIADTLVRAAEEHDVDPTHMRSILKRHGRDQRVENRQWLEGLAVRSTDVYGQAWAKYITGREMLMTNEERTAMSVGSNTNGGFLVPTHLDPSIILTNSGSSNALRAISRVVTLTVGNSWNGITSAGVTASWDAELSEASDDTPADYAHPNVPVYMMRGFAQASYEAFEDIDNLGSDVLMMLADAKDRLEGTAHCTGSGSAQPTGIFTALDANTNVEVTSTTAATIGLVDLQGLKRSVPVRWRKMGTWVYAPVYGDAIKALGTAISASYSSDITVENTEKLLGRPVVETDDAPTTQTTTVRDNEIVYGDFSNFLIVDKPGSTAIEFIPQLFSTTTNLPDGRRGWIMHHRTGSDSINDLAFRLLQDKTSA